jgi:signal transduction histidine kinase
VALRSGRREIAPDVERCEFMVGTKDLETYRATGIRAVQSTPLFSRGGTIVGIISTHWREPHEPSSRDLRLFDILARQAADLIERRRGEEELRTLNAELEERVWERTRSLEETIGELDSFCYTVAHDLRTPLRAVHSFGEMLLETAASKLDETERGYYAAMIRAGGRMDALISDLLAYTRLTRQEVSLQELDPGVVVDRVLDELRPDLIAKRADVSVARPLPKVLAQPVLLGQALANLISNAAKFVAPGQRPRIRIGAESGNGRVRLWVEDDGIGIAPQYQGKLFKVFERLNPATDYPGTGIGLAIVRRAAERMSGTAGVESQEGKGSRFWLDLGAGGPGA